jgi:hypothetical protein
MNHRRYDRVTGPFDARHTDRPDLPLLIYDLNLGGCFVNSTHEQPDGSQFGLRIALPHDEWITVSAEALYHLQYGFAARFVDLDADTAGRITRTVDKLKGR